MPSLAWIRVPSSQINDEHRQVILWFYVTTTWAVGAVGVVELFHPIGTNLAS
jgi:hypothetical protein